MLTYIHIYSYIYIIRTLINNNTHKLLRTYIHYILSYSMVQMPLEMLIILQLVMKFLAFHGTRYFFAALTSDSHLSLPCALPIQSIYPHSTYWSSLIILSTHLRRGLPSGLFKTGFRNKNRHTPPPRRWEHVHRPSISCNIVCIYIYIYICIESYM